MRYRVGKERDDRPRDMHDVAPAKRKSDERLMMMIGKDA